MTQYFNFGALLRLIIINHKGYLYRLWYILITITKTLSAFYYAYLAAFKDTHKENLNIVNILELLFLIDCLIHFILTYSTNPLDHSSAVVDDISKIGENYAKGDFIYDLVPLLPFQFLEISRHREAYFYILKVMRLSSSLSYFNVGRLMSIIKHW